MRFNQGFKELWGGSFRRPAITFRTLTMGFSWLGMGVFLDSWWGWLVAGYAGPILGVGLTFPIHWVGKIGFNGNGQKKN